MTSLPSTGHSCALIGPHYSLVSCPAVPAPEDLPLAFALVLVLLLVVAAACAAAGGRSPLHAVFFAGSLHPAATASPHSSSSCGLRNSNRDPVAEVSVSS